MWIRIAKFLAQLIVAVSLFFGLIYFAIRASREDRRSLNLHSKHAIGKIVKKGSRSSVYWTFNDGIFSGRVSENIDFDGMLSGEEYHGIYDSTNTNIGKLDLLRPYLDNKVVDTTYAVEVLNFPLKQTSASILYTYKVENVAYKRKLPIRRDEASVSYRNGKRWMVVYVVENPQMGYLYPLE